jgi:hypothetical protein
LLLPLLPPLLLLRLLVLLLLLLLPLLLPLRVLPDGHLKNCAPPPTPPKICALRPAGIIACLFSAAATAAAAASATAAARTARGTPEELRPAPCAPQNLCPAPQSAPAAKWAAETHLAQLFPSKLRLLLHLAAAVQAASSATAWPRPGSVTFVLPRGPSLVAAVSCALLRQGWG